VFDQICNFSNSKSPGLDGFHVRLLKLAAPVICKSLAYICNLSLYTATFPHDWKRAKVTPIYKDGDKYDVCNYRPISVLPVISKILERAVHDQLYDYLTKFDVLNSNQSGFRKSHSTNTTLLDVSDYILHHMNDGKVTAAIFLDLKKAFDTVNHKILIDKLYLYGVKGKALDWFTSYLLHRSQIVNINASFSDPKNIDIGVPQGSILGPLLFIIYVNSLSDCVTCKCVMYADDTTLLCSSSDPDSLQSELNSNNNIAIWFQNNQLTLNIKKTKLMLFGTKYFFFKFNIFLLCKVM
jgi:retron-type reverse transcriptase